MTKADLIYQHNIQRILTEGVWDEHPRPRYASDGAPAFTRYITQVMEEYDLTRGELPLTTLRPIACANSFKECLWIYSDQTADLSTLEGKYGIHWWRAWEVGDGTIGQRYGATVSRYDLMNRLLEGLKSDPFGRRHIINLWQEGDFQETDGLLPCAFQTMWSVRQIDGVKFLDLTLTQRSSDYLVAGHINMIQYVALQMMAAHECGMVPGKFVRFTQNLHIYDRHFDQARELLRRTPSDLQPRLILNAEGKSFYDITFDDFTISNYQPVRPQLTFELGI